MAAQLNVLKPDEKSGQDCRAFFSTVRAVWMPLYSRQCARNAVLQGYGSVKEAAGFFLPRGVYAYPYCTGTVHCADEGVDNYRVRKISLYNGIAGKKPSVLKERMDAEIFSLTG